MTVYGRQETWEDSPEGWPRRFRTAPATQFRLDGRPISQWSRLAAGRSDDLGATRLASSECHCNENPDTHVRRSNPTRGARRQGISHAPLAPAVFRAPGQEFADFLHSETQSPAMDTTVAVMTDTGVSASANTNGRLTAAQFSAFAGVDDWQVLWAADTRRLAS